MPTSPDAAGEPVDPAVRSLLWRLRARLVVPPDEQRAADDLDRILAAAQACAHGDAEIAGVEDEAVTTRLAPVGALERTAREPRIHALSRIAAAAVLVVAVGGGVATARDGVVIDALLGRAPAADTADTSALAVDPDPAETDGADQDLPEPTAVPLVEPDDSADDEAPAMSDDTESSDTDPADVTDAADAAPEPEPQPEPEPEPAPRSEPSAPSDGGGAPDPEPSAPVVEDAPTESVIAAPPSQPDVDGFAGPTPCPEDQDLATCLDARQGVDDPAGADDTDPADDGATADDEPSSDTSDDESEQEKLARRRGGG